MKQRLRALAATTALATAAGALALAPAPAAQAADYDRTKVEAGASWLTGRMTGGLLSTSYEGVSYKDYGTSVDAALAFLAVGRTADADVVADAVAAEIDNYITGESYGDVGSTYAGPVAKAAVLARATGRDVRSFGGKDLVARLENQTNDAGRIHDTSSFGTDYANTIGQTFAVRALVDAASVEATAAEAFLLDQQCPGGGFRLFFGDTECTDGAAADPDATSLFLLQHGSSTDPEISAAVTEALTWLAGRQLADGSFKGGTSTDYSNANSTGLAGWALGEAGRTAAAERAASWLARLSVAEPQGCATNLTPHTGAIAYTPEVLDQGRTGALDAYTWQLASAQALPALAWLPVWTQSVTLSGPTGFQRAGSNATYVVSGARPGTALCLAAGGSHLVTADAAGAVTHTAALPGQTATFTATVADHTGTRGTVSARVLGPLTIPVRNARRVERGRRLLVRVSGLDAGERVVIRFRGQRKAVGTASPTGTFQRKIRVGRKVGRAKLVVVGQFPDLRKRTKTVRVVR